MSMFSKHRVGRTAGGIALAASVAMMSSGCGLLGRNNPQPDNSTSRRTGKQLARDRSLSAINESAGEAIESADLDSELLRQFPEADANNDGTLSMEELDQWSLAMVLKDFPEADANKDGVLSENELELWSRQQILADFPEADTNQDGQLTDAELDAFFGSQDDFVSFDAIPCAEGTEIAAASKMVELDSAELGAGQIPDDLRRELAADMPEADLNKDGSLSDAELDATIASFEAVKLDPDFDTGIDIVILGDCAIFDPSVIDGDPDAFDEWLVVSIDAPEADLDNDGTVTEDELDTWFAQQILEDFPEADANKDGTLSETELATWENQQILKEIPEADANKDGTLTEAELAAWENQQLLADFPDADANQDGTLTEEEMSGWFDQQLLRDFPEADIDRDGILTEAEISKFFAVAELHLGQQAGVANTSQ